MLETKFQKKLGNSGGGIVFLFCVVFLFLRKLKFLTEGLNFATLLWSWNVPCLNCFDIFLKRLILCFLKKIRISYIKKSQYLQKNVEEKKIQFETLLYVRYVGVNWLLYHVHLQWIFQNSLDDCSAPSGYYLASCNILVPCCCGRPWLRKSLQEIPEDLLCYMLPTCQGLAWQIEN